MTTAARTQSRSDSRWYDRDGSPQYEVIGRSTGRPRPVTIADARKNGWLPSVTTILKVLHKQALVDWLCEQSALAVLTAPKLDGEALDAFVHRVLHTERQQDQEAQRARDLGTEIHGGMESALRGEAYPIHLQVYIEPAMAALKPFGYIQATEAIVVGDGYAGKMDAKFRNGGCVTILDFKTAKTLPKKGSWDEHRLQLSAYAEATDDATQTANLYISTVEPGKVHLDVHESWAPTFTNGFKPLLAVWQWLNDYRP